MRIFKSIRRIFLGLLIAVIIFEALSLSSCGLRIDDIIIPKEIVEMNSSTAEGYISSLKSLVIYEESELGTLEANDDGSVSVCITDVQQQNWQTVLDGYIDVLVYNIKELGKDIEIADDHKSWTYSVNEDFLNSEDADWSINQMVHILLLSQLFANPKDELQLSTTIKNIETGEDVKTTEWPVYENYCKN